MFRVFCNLSIDGTQIYQHKETIQLSPSTVREATIYETRRRIGSEQFGISPRSNRDMTKNEQHIEEKYEVTISANYDEFGLKPLPSKSMKKQSATSEGYIIKFSDKKKQMYFFVNRFELNEEMYIACVLVNESLYDNNVDKKKVVKYIIK